MIEAQYINPYIRYEIHVEATETNPLGFARRLSEFRAFRIRLTCFYETLAGKQKVFHITAPGSFGTFVEDTLRRWKETNDHELVYAAKGI